MVFEFDLKIEAPTANEAQRKAKAGGILIARLKTDELEKLAHVVLHEPQKLALARKFL